MRGWLATGLVIAGLFVSGCGGDDDNSSTTVVSLDLNPESTVPAPVVENTTTTAPETSLTTARAIADKIAAGGLGCSDRQPQAPQPAPDFPLPSEILVCTVSGQKTGITVYAKEDDPEAARVASSKILCKEIGKADTEKRSSVYGEFFVIGTENGDPGVAAKIAEVTGGEVKPFTC